ncbi:MAG TPA: hypothetical protein VG474_05540 [Solirubrobacteraceae bacterium]|nr:hypothetical protein [Solirubrobacteraceae bacterium]
MPAVVSCILLAVAVLLTGSATAGAQAGEYLPCDAPGDAILVAVSGAGCDEVSSLAASVVSAPTSAAAGLLRAGGWAPLRAAATDDRRAHDIVATRGLAALRIQRPGAAPDVDGWAAGRELILARGRLVGGKRPPRGSVVCTSAFLVRLGRHPGGLSAAHCGGLRRDGTTHRRNAALRRPPQAGIVLGRVQRNLQRKRRLDALVLPVPSGPQRPSAAVVNRGVSRPPWFVVGRARSLPGRRVCYTGRTSGVDRCGVIVRSFPGTRGLACTTITAREGDSGGPVYTYPSARGTVRAVGITTLVFGLLQSMCFTPIEPVLDALDARLVTATAA